MVKLKDIGEGEAKKVVTIDHRNQFVREVGKHLMAIAPKFGNICFNYKDGNYINATIEESVK